MHRWTDPSQTPSGLRPCVATFGNFDGVHLGHRGVLARLVEEGTRRGVASVAVTFDPHPAAIFHPDTLELIAPGRLRDELLETVGIDGLLVLDFTREFADQTAEEDQRSVSPRSSKTTTSNPWAAPSSRRVPTSPV